MEVFPAFRLPAALALLVAGAVLAGCSNRSDPPEGFVAARQIADAADLIGGPRAEGRVGDWLLANDHVRVVIGGVDSPVFNPFGGSIVDADVVRPGENGQDHFGEAFATVNITTALKPELIDVPEDGSNRRRASIRVKGTGFPFPIVPEIPGLTSPVAIDVETVYSITPEASSILVETTITMRETETTLVQNYDVLLFGAGLDLFGSPKGDGETGTFDWYGGDTAGVAYAWVPLDVPTMNIPFADASQQITQMGPLEIAPSKHKSFRRRLVIAAPDLGAVNAEIARVRGHSTGMLTGSVRDTVGAPVADAFVRIRAVGRDEDADGQDDFAGRARSSADGNFAIALRPGTYRAVVSAELRGQGDPLEFPIKKGKTSQILFILPAVGTISASPLDAADASRIPGKLTVVDGSGAIIARALAGVNTAAVVAVPPGSYTAYVSHGSEWDLRQSTVLVTAGGATAVPAADATLARRIATPGFLAGDFHIHSVQSRDSGVPLVTRVLSLAAEGLEYVSSTDHDRASDFSPHIAALGLEGEIASVVGTEASIPLYGHFNAYPFPLATADGTSNLWFDEALGRTRNGVEILAHLRAVPGGDRLVQMNHPRSNQGYLASVQFDTATGLGDEPVELAFDTIEVNGEIDPVPGSTMRDWLAILKLGHKMVAVGVSDSHSTWNPGYPRTMVYVGTDEPATMAPPLGTAAFIAGMRSGKVTVSSGPFVLCSASTLAQTAGLGDTLDATAGAAVDVHVHIDSPSFAPFDTLKLYENGVLVVTQPLIPALANGHFVADVTIARAPVADTFYVAVVTGGGTLFPVSGQPVYAYTNPVYVDRAPAGYTAPGL